MSHTKEKELFFKIKKSLLQSKSVSSAICFLNSFEKSIKNKDFCDLGFRNKHLKQVDDFIMDINECDSFDLINNEFVAYLDGKYQKEDKAVDQALIIYSKLETLLNNSRKQFLFDFVKEIAKTSNEDMCFYDFVGETKDNIDISTLKSFYSDINKDKSITQALSINALYIDEDFDAKTGKFKLYFYISNKFCNKINISKTYLTDFLTKKILFDVNSFKETDLNEIAVNYDYEFISTKLAKINFLNFLSNNKIKEIQNILNKK